MSSSCSGDELNVQLKHNCRSWMFCWSSSRHSWNSPNTCSWDWMCLCCFLLLKDSWRWGRGELRICCLPSGSLVHLMSWCLDQLFSEVGPVVLSGECPEWTGRVSLLPVPALHFNQGMFCEAGLFLLQEPKVISPSHTGYSGGLGHCSCKTSAFSLLGWEWEGGKHQSASPRGS